MNFYENGQSFKNQNDWLVYREVPLGLVVHVINHINKNKECVTWVEEIALRQWRKKLPGC